MSGGGDSGSEYEVNVNLTAMLDVLTNLLFFLMFGLAAQQTSIELEGGVQLPVSTAQLPPKKNTNVVVGERELRIDKEVIASIKDGRIQGTRDDGRVEALYRKLVTIRGKRVAAAAPGSEGEEETLFILADKKTPYSLLRRVMMTGAEAGYPKFRMAVLMQ
jgi:biopolymer transport protein TolR